MKAELRAEPVIVHREKAVHLKEPVTTDKAGTFVAPLTVPVLTVAPLRLCL